MANRISITRGYKLTPEGLQPMTLEEGLEVKPEEKVNKDGVKVKTGKDILTIPFRAEDGSLILRDFYFVMDTDTELGELVEAAIGEIPVEIDDLEELLVGKQVTVKVVHNPSKKTNKVFANIIAFYSLDYEDEEEELELEEADETETVMTEDDLDLEDETEESEGEDFDWDSDEKGKNEEFEMDDDEDREVDNHGSYQPDHDELDDEPKQETQPYKSRRKRL